MKTNLKVYSLFTIAIFSCAPDNKNQVEISKKETAAEETIDPLDDSGTSNFTVLSPLILQ